MIATELASGYLTRSQAARLLGCSGELIVRAWNTGQLPSVKTPLGRLVLIEDVEAFKARREARKNERTGG